MQADQSLWMGVSPPAARRLLLAALESFAAVGYHATTTRDIAIAAEMSPAALYVHFSSKEELLQRLNRIGYDAGLRMFDDAIRSGTDPAERIRNAVQCSTRWHLENQTLAKVLHYELDALPGTSREEIRSLRLRFEKKLGTEIDAGIAAGLFDVVDVPGAARAILSLSVDVVRWYSPRSRRSPTEIANLYGELAVRMLSS